MRIIVRTGRMCGAVPVVVGGPGACAECFRLLTVDAWDGGDCWCGEPVCYYCKEREPHINCGGE